MAQCERSLPLSEGSGKAVEWICCDARMFVLRVREAGQPVAAAKMSPGVQAARVRGGMSLHAEAQAQRCGNTMAMRGMSRRVPP